MNVMRHIAGTIVSFGYPEVLVEVFTPVVGGRR